MYFIFSYLYWHYTKAFLNIYGIFSNFIWATYRFFSISLLLKTFFSPWRRLGGQYSKKFSVEDFFGTFVVNTLMRLVGMMARFIIICVGIICLVLILLCEILFFISWILLPLILFWLIISGISKIM